MPALVYGARPTRQKAAKTRVVRSGTGRFDSSQLALMKGMTMKLGLLFLIGLAGCAAAPTTNLTYRTPGTCHYDYGRRYSVEFKDGDTRLVSTDCETTEQVLRGRI